MSKNPFLVEDIKNWSVIIASFSIGVALSLWRWGGRALWMQLVAGAIYGTATAFIGVMLYVWATRTSSW